MQIAKKKRKENVVEYILYLYQVEDLIRAFKMDMGLIGENLVAAYQDKEDIRLQVYDWYENLLTMMEKEELQEKGHLQFLRNLVNELNELHLKLLESNEVESYLPVFQRVAGLITELKQKNKEADNDIQIAMDAVYVFLILKMQKKTISPETQAAVQGISQWLNVLSVQFKRYEAGELTF